MKPSVAGDIRHLSTSLPEISLPDLAPMTGLHGAQSRSHLSTYNSCLEASCDCRDDGKNTSLSKV
jgi:hypothetical protein